MAFNRLQEKIRQKLNDLSEAKIFRSPEEQAQFFKIARIVCLGFWFLSLIRLLSTSEAVAPLIVFSVLFVLIEIFQPDERPK